jgi:glycosyltransferase involved in cell wall biosynthesis
MKLLIATDNYLPRRDGITRFLLELSPSLKKEYELSIICPETKEKTGINTYGIKPSGIQIGDFRMPKFSIREVYKAVKENDIIFTQTIGPIGFLSIILAWIKRKKIVCFIHSIESELVPKAMRFNYFKKIISGIVREYSKFLYNKATKLIVPSEGVYEILTWMKIKTRKEIVNLGVDTQQFKKLKTQTKKSLGLEKKLVIGYHGRISREKDLTTLLRAYLRIRRKYDNTALLIIGSGVQQIEKKLASAPGVVMVGSTNEVNKYLNAMDIYVLPSLTETTSLSVLEAMSVNLPVISTPVGYVQDYITEGKTGLFFIKTDSFSLSKQIELLINNPSLRIKLGKNARKMVEKKFSWKHTSEQLLKFLKDV